MHLSTRHRTWHWLDILFEIYEQVKQFIGEIRLLFCHRVCYRGQGIYKNVERFWPQWWVCLWSRLESNQIFPNLSPLFDHKIILNNLSEHNSLKQNLLIFSTVHFAMHNKNSVYIYSRVRHLCYTCTNVHLCMYLVWHFKST